MPWPGDEVGAEAEVAGFSAFVAGEFADHEAYVSLGEMVAGTRAARVGTGIAYAFSRTPFAHAAAIRHLHARAPGRIFVGLGSGAYRVNRDWFGVEADRPVARMADLVGAVKAFLHAENGRPVRYEGEFYTIDAAIQAPVLGRLDVPILLGAFNKGMVATAARVADGLIGHGLFTTRWWQETVRPAIDAGRAADAAPLEYGWVITAIDDADPARAVLDARRMVAFYLTVKTYDPLVELHGWQEPVAALRAAFRKGDTEGMAAAVSDDMVQAITLCGTTDQARAALRRRGEGLPRDVAFFSPPSFLVSSRRRAAYSRASLALKEGT